MKRTFSKLFATGLLSALVGFSGGPLSNTELAAEPFNQAIQPCLDPDDAAVLCPNGEVTDVIHVTSDNNAAWTTVQPALINFPAYLIATPPGGKVLYYVKVYQGKNWIDQHMIHNPNVDGQDSYNFNGLLWGGTHNLSGSEKAQLAATCNKKLNGVAANQPQHQFTTGIPLTRLARFRTTGENISYSDAVPVTDTWSVTVICDSFTRQLPATDLSTDLPDPKIIAVGLGLSTNGPIAFGTLEYTGICPVGITLNMLWTTNIPTGLKSYVKHKDLAGQANWTSSTFDVTTNQSAYGGNWKKEMTDLMSIPFAGVAPANGGGGVVGGNNPGGLGFNPGGGGGGVNPAGNLGAGNAGTNSDMTQYIGYFQLVTYKNKKVVPVLLPGGGLSNTTIYEGQKLSGWRKYIITCEPRKNVAIPDGPGGVTTGQTDQTAAETKRKAAAAVIAKRKAAAAVIAKRKAAAAVIAKRKAAAAVIAKRKAAAAVIAKRKAAAAVIAKRKAAAAVIVKRKAAAAALAKRKAAAAALAKRQAIAAALALAKRKAAAAKKR